MLAMFEGAFLFLMLQLPATILLGLVAGFLLTHIALTRRGRVSLRANGAIVLILGLEAAVVAQRPGPWPILGAVFLVAVSGSALVDAGVILALDPRQVEPRFSHRGRRVAAGVVAIGLTTLVVAAAAVAKYVVALDPAAVSLRDGPIGLLLILGPLAAGDFIVRTPSRPAAEDRAIEK